MHAPAPMYEMEKPCTFYGEDPARQPFHVSFYDIHVRILLGKRQKFVREHDMARLLIVDDDPHLRKLVHTYAQAERYDCDEAESGHAALEKMQGTPYDLIVLDVMMPGMDGFAALGEIRKQHQTPVIMLTARDEEYDKLLGFTLGADDYVSKPFSPKELMARVGAVLKRSHRALSGEMQYGSLCIHQGARSVTLDGKPLSMTPKEFDLLVVLAQHERLVLSREQLLEKVWGYNYLGDARTVDTHIKSLRDHLGSMRKIIQTAWGVGYKFEYNEDA